jgi:hypothetical protein
MIPPFLDLVTKHACEILQEALSSNTNKWQLQVHMEKLHQKTQALHITWPELQMGLAKMLCG